MHNKNLFGFDVELKLGQALKLGFRSKDKLEGKIVTETDYHYLFLAHPLIKK